MQETHFSREFDGVLVPYSYYEEFSNHLRQRREHAVCAGKSFQPRYLVPWCLVTKKGETKELELSIAMAALRRCRLPLQHWHRRIFFSQCLISLRMKLSCLSKGCHFQYWEVSFLCLVQRTYQVTWAVVSVELDEAAPDIPRRRRK